MVVHCHNTGDKAHVQWTPYSKAKERYRELNGKVVDDKGEIQYLLHGAWDKGMTRKRPGVCCTVIARNFQGPNFSLMQGKLL